MIDLKFLSESICYVLSIFESKQIKMKRILMIWMVLSFSFVYSQQQGFDDLDKVFDECEKEYQQKNNPYAVSPNDTERMREMKKRLVLKDSKN